MSVLGMAARQLAEVLEQENAALVRLDLAAATALLGIKRDALSLFQSAAATQPVLTGPDETMRILAVRLHDASQANKRLLEKAMVAQQYIMALLAQAARQTAVSKRYGSRGHYAGGVAERAFALNARA